MELELGTQNIHLAGNSRRFCHWVRATFGAPCAYLPNLYSLDADAVWQRPPFTDGTLRIGVFGATRPLKNLMSAAGAALEISQSLRVQLELWVSSGRTEAGGDAVLGAVQEMLRGLPHVRLVTNGWQPWPKFRKAVGFMHLLLQPSYTESFNMVTADGVAECVPSVVSNAIDWAPEHWKANVDDVLDIARVGRQLLYDPRAIHDGLRALREYVEDGLRSYEKYFRQLQLLVLLFDEHAIAIGIETISLSHCMSIRGECEFRTRKSTHKHQQTRLRQVKIRKHRARPAETETWTDKQIRLSLKRFEAPTKQRCFYGSHACGSHAKPPFRSLHLRGV